MTESTATKPKEFFGHPGGLSTLFFTEMWERMSYYGMRVLLVLFMTASLQEGGLGFTVAAASAIYGLYTGSVYFMGLPGGWIADRLIGGQRAVWYGGIVIMCGHIVLAIPGESTFFIGLVLVVLGTGLLKPNIGAMVGQLYSDGDQRRDSGYTLYYMGINIGSIIGYTVTGELQKQGWHMAFGAAAVGMAIGLIIYRLTAYKLDGAGSKPSVELDPKLAKLSWQIIAGFLVLLAVVAYLMLNGSLTVDAVTMAQSVAVTITIVFLVYFGAIYYMGSLTMVEKYRLRALFLVCLASICFWSGFEQAGSSLNLFARDFTDRMIGDYEIATAYFQSLNAFFIITLSPFIAALWINLAKRMITPSYGFKCALGLIIMALGFIVMFFAAQAAASGLKVAPYWLVATYFCHTVGEICLSPVALSAVSKLSPKRFAGQMMGVFVLTYSIGNVVAGLLAGSFDPNNVEQMPNLYLQIALFGIGVGIILILVNFKTKHWEKFEPSEEQTAEAKPASA